MVNVLVGWEHNFLLPEDSYIVSFSDMNWTNCSEIMTWFLEIVPASASRAITKFKPSISLEKVKGLFAAYNRSHGACIRKLQAFDGKIIWSEHAHAPSTHTITETSLSIDLSLKNASSKQHKELVSVFLSSAQHAMTCDGFSFGTSGIIVEANA